MSLVNLGIIIGIAKMRMARGHIKEEQIMSGTWMLRESQYWIQVNATGIIQIGIIRLIVVHYAHQISTNFHMVSLYACNYHLRCGSGGNARGG